MLSSFFIGLLCSDADELFKDQAHLCIVHSLGAEIELVVHEVFDYQIEQIGFLQTGDLLREGKVFDYLLNVWREVVYVALQVDGDAIGIIQQFLHVQAGFIVKRNTCDPDQALGDYVIRFTIEMRELG